MQAMTSSKERAPSPGSIGVKLVRGPFVDLPAHPGHCETPDDLIALCTAYHRSVPEALLGADLFAGAGGLSLGLKQAGIEVVLGVDHYGESVRTHAHHFPGLSVDWDLSDPEKIEAVASLMTRCGISVLAGGPPCQPFSKAGRSRIRNLVRQGQREAHDRRRDLWWSFMEVVDRARPRAVIIENVPDMALDTEMFIIRSIVERLEAMDYSVEQRVVDSWRYGIPQFRQRLIIVALADNTQFIWPKEAAEPVTVWNAIGDLPPVEGGWRPDGGADGWAEYGGPRTAFQRLMREGVPAGESGRVYDHITRPVRPDDAKAFALMGPDTKYSDLPDEFKRYRDDIFDDKYKRLNENDLSRTITAHIAKDGYWYIHPRQGRTITVREAARLQTFPDSYRFNGPPSAAFKQIGNAVPPLLGRHLARAIRASLDNPVIKRTSTQEIASRLSNWFVNRKELTFPWLRGNRWEVLLAGILMDRLPTPLIRDAWALIRTTLSAPQLTVDNADVLHALGVLIGRPARADLALSLAKVLLDRQRVRDDELYSLPGISQPTASLAVLVGGSSGEEPVTNSAGVFRVAARYVGRSVDLHNRNTDGRLAIARLIGNGRTSRDAQLALIEIAGAVCFPDRPDCSACPLRTSCLTGLSRTRNVISDGQ